MFHLKPKPSPPWSVGRETPGKGGRLFGDGDCARKAAVNELVGLLEEGDRLAVLLASVGVGKPLALPPRIVEVEHRGDGVDAQPVDMEAIDPIEGVAIEEVGDLVPAEVVDRRIPVGMEALAGIRVLVEGGAVEVGEPMFVGREMRRDPIDDHAEARGVRLVDEAGEPCRLAMTSCRREKAERLVAPGFVERMLADRQQLEVRVTQVRDIGDEFVGKLIIGEKPAVWTPFPRTEMDFVDRHRLAVRLALRAHRHVVGVVPGEVGAIGDNRSCRRPEFRLEAERIGLQRQQHAVRSGEFELVDRSRPMWGTKISHRPLS